MLETHLLLHGTYQIMLLLDSGRFTHIMAFHIQMVKNRFLIPRGCFPENKWSKSQRIACPISHDPVPRGCPKSRRISGSIPREKNRFQSVEYPVSQEMFRILEDKWFDSQRISGQNPRQ